MEWGPFCVTLAVFRCARAQILADRERMLAIEHIAAESGKAADIDLDRQVLAVADVGPSGTRLAVASVGQDRSPQKAPPVHFPSKSIAGGAVKREPQKRKFLALGMAVSGFIHIAAIAALAMTFAAIQPYAEAEDDAVEISVVSSVPQPPSVSLPPPALPPRTLSADLLPGPEMPAPAPPPRMLSAELLPAPQLPAPAPPPALPLALAPPPKIALPPPTPDPAGILAAAAKPVPEVARPAQARPKTRLQQPSKAATDAGRSRELLEERRKAASARKARQEAELAAERRKKERARKIARSRADRRRAAIEARNKARVASRRAASAASRASAGSRASAAAYSGIVAARLRRNLPSGEMARQAQGTAYVSFNIAASGAATGVRLARSSGHRVLDRAAVAMVRRASPFPPPPPGARRAFRVPVRFRR